MYIILTGQPVQISFKSILHVVDPKIYTTETEKYIKNNYIYTMYKVYIPGLCPIKKDTLRNFSTLIVHNSKQPQVFLKDIKSDPVLVDLLRYYINHTSKCCIGIQYGAEILQSKLLYRYNGLDTNGPCIYEIKGLDLLPSPVFTTSYNNTDIKMYYGLLDRSKKYPIYCFPKGTGYKSDDKSIVGNYNYIYLFKDGSCYLVTKDTGHDHTNKELLDRLYEQHSALGYKDLKIVTWAANKW